MCDAQHRHLSAQEEHENGNVVGLDVATGEALDPVLSGIYDNYLVKKQILQSSPVIASQLLLVDEVTSHVKLLKPLYPAPE